MQQSWEISKRVCHFYFFIFFAKKLNFDLLGADSSQLLCRLEGPLLPLSREVEEFKIALNLTILWDFLMQIFNEK